MKKPKPQRMWATIELDGSIYEAKVFRELLHVHYGQEIVPVEVRVIERKKPKARKMVGDDKTQE